MSPLCAKTPWTKRAARSTGEVARGTWGYGVLGSVGRRVRWITMLPGRLSCCYTYPYNYRVIPTRNNYRVIPTDVYVLS